MEIRIKKILDYGIKGLRHSKKNLNKTEIETGSNQNHMQTWKTYARFNLATIFFPGSAFGVSSCFQIGAKHDCVSTSLNVPLYLE